MARLIDADALLEKTMEWSSAALNQVEKTMNDEDLTEWRKWSVILREREAFEKDIQDAPTVSPVPEWIPVSERLPESSGRVLATVRGVHGDVVRIVWFGMYDGEMCFFHSDLEWGDYPYDKDQVSAWMPFPSSYRQDN